MTPAMDILYLAHRIPYPPNKGDKLRAFRQIQYLARSHRLWCACFIDDPDDLVHVPALRAYCHELAALRLSRASALLRAAAGLTTGATFTESFYSSTSMKRFLDDWLRQVQFDAVVAFSSAMAPYALRIPAPRRILDFCDLDSRKWRDYAASSPLWLRPLYTLEAARLARREREWISAFDDSILITPREVDLLPPPLRPRVHVISNGVSDSPDVQTAVSHRSADPVVGFLGQMNYKPNIDAVLWFARRCLPVLHMLHPRITFRIVGRHPTRAVRGLARLAGVEVIGEVPDAAAELRRFSVCIAPLHIARGLPNKVLEAFAAGVPVVTTSAVAAALIIRNEVEALIADDPESFSAAVYRLLHDKALAARITAVAEQFVHRNHQWKNELQRLEVLVTGARRTTDLRDSAPPRPTRAAVCAVPLTP